MAKTYDLKNVICSIGGVTISGYGESDAIGVEWDEDLVTQTPTADGTVVYSRNNNRGCTVTVTLMQTSRAYALLAGLLEVQHGDSLGIGLPQIPLLPFLLLDPATGDQLGSMDCVFLNRPAPSKGKTIGEVEFRLHLPSPKPVYGAANLI